MKATYELNTMNRSHYFTTLREARKFVSEMRLHPAHPLRRIWKIVNGTATLVQ